MGKRPRILFYAGKGGVGKTSVASATGLRSAELGNRTVILSLDMAHSLSDIFDLKKDLLDQNKGRPIQVEENLSIQELDIEEELRRYWGDIYKYISLLFNTSGLDEILAEELAVLPGMEEISLLLYINQYVRNDDYDVMILDCAPTGESLRFISIPTTLEWYMKRIFRVERSIARYVRPVAKRLYDVPLPGEDYFEAVQYLFERLQGVDRLLTDPEITSVRLVTNPEKVVLKETQRAFMYFCLYKMNIDGIIMNRVFPEAVRDEYFRAKKKSQGKYLKEAKTYFSPVPIFPVTLFRDEIVGLKELRRLARELYSGRDPVEHFFRGEPYRLTKENGNYRLILKLPFIEKDDIQLNQISEELIIRIGSFKKHMILPRHVAAARPLKAWIENQHLKIEFMGENDHGQTEE